MKKKVLSFVLSLAFVLQIIPVGTISVASEKIQTSGTIGENLSWTLDVDSYTLFISGIGDMQDNPGGFLPTEWHDVESIIIDNGVTSIGSYAFLDCSNLIYITIPVSLTEIHKGAFCGCSSLSQVKYLGSEQQWNNIWIDNLGEKNDPLLSAEKECFGYPEATQVIINDITIIEGADTYHMTDYIDDSDVEWELYNYNTNGTVFFADGTEAEISWNYCWANNDCFDAVRFTDTQSALTPWKVNHTYSVNAEIFGAHTTFSVTIVENPVESIEIQPVTIVEGTGIATSYCWIDEQEVEYPVYSYNISGYTVNYKSGESEYIPDWDTIEIYGQEYFINIQDDQSYTNQWGLGTHTAHASLAGIAECDFDVNIVSSPIKNIIIDDIELKEGENGWDCEEYDEYGNVKGTYFRYSTTPDNMTVEFNDGTSYTGSYWDMNEQYGFEAYTEDDQSFDNPWLPGMHTAKLSVAGKEVIYNINIIASPIQNAIIPSINLIEGADCSEYDVYDEYGNCIGTYNHYDIFPDQLTIECTDGSSHTGEIWELENELGVSIWFNDDQSYDNQWGIGTHTATIVVGGKSFNYDIVITESPIQYVAIDRITLIEGIDGYYYEGEFIYTLPENFEFVATLNDGTVVTSHNNKYGMPSIEIGNKSYGIDLSAFEKEDHSNWKAGNTYQVTAKLCGKPCIMYVKIVANTYKSLTLEDSGDLYLVFTKNDGTQDRQKVISFDARAAGDDGRFMGILTTDKAQYQNALFTVDKPDDMFEKGSGFYLQCTDNLRLQIGELTSNSLEKSNWLAIQLSYNSIVFITIIYSWYAEQLGHPFNGFDGTVTAENIDAIVTLAVNVCDYFGCGDIGENGYPYGAFDVASVKKDVEMLFGIKDIDLSGFSGYDASTGRVHVLLIAGGLGPTERTLKYENGKWEIEYSVYTDEAMTSMCDYVKVILNSDAKIETIDFTDDVYKRVPGDINLDGKVDARDVLTYKAYFAEMITIEQEAADNADFNFDGDVNSCDIYLIKANIVMLNVN